MARMLPHLALVPLLIIWVGIGEEMKITLVALGVFFPLYFNVYAGIRDIDERLIEAARTYGLGPWARVWQVILPGGLPSLFLGLFVYALRGLLSDLALRAAERRALSWRRGLQAR